MAVGKCTLDALKDETWFIKWLSELQRPFEDVQELLMRVAETRDFETPSPPPTRENTQSIPGHMFMEVTFKDHTSVSRIFTNEELAKRKEYVTNGEKR